MITRPEPTPTPPELARAPECASIALLDNALYTTAFALLAANPRIADADYEVGVLNRREIIADVIVKHADVLQSALRSYRDVAYDWDRFHIENDDEPF